jgi:hypothetical protein
MALTHCCGFGEGVTANNIGADPGGHWFDNSASITYDNTVTRTPFGTHTLKIDQINARAQWIPRDAANAINVGRIYAKWSLLPTADTNVFLSHAGGVCFESSDNKLYACVSASNRAASGGYTIQTGRWYKIDVITNTSANPHTINATVTDVTPGLGDFVPTALTQHTRAASATTGRTWELGTTGTVSTGTVNYADFACGMGDTADYPIRHGFVQVFAASIDGTHTSTGTNIRKGTIATPDGTGITSATTDAYEWINAIPAPGGISDATRIWNGFAVAATEYAESRFSNTSLPGPISVVEFLCGSRSSSGADTVAFDIRTYDNGTEDVVFSPSGGLTTSTQWRHQGYATMPADGLPWTIARFNDFRGRFGWVTNAKPYLQSMLLEADFPEDNLWYSGLGRPFGQRGMRQMNQLLAM